MCKNYRLSVFDVTWRSIPTKHTCIFPTYAYTYAYLHIHAHLNIHTYIVTPTTIREISEIYLNVDCNLETTINRCTDK